MYKSRTIELVHDASLECDYLDEIIPILKRLTPDVRITSKEPTAYLAWEWLIPTSVIIVIGKPLLDGFLQELGAEGARTLRAALKNVFKKTKNQNRRLWTLEDLRTAKKQLRRDPRTSVDTSNLGSPAQPFTLEFRLEARGYARFVFPYELEDPELDRALDTLPRAISEVTELTRVRTELNRRLKELLKSSLHEAERLLATRSRDLDLEIIYVYLRERSKWIDVKVELDREIRAKIQPLKDSEDKAT